MKNDHLGERRQRGSFARTPKLGYYLIITDTDETEKNFFNGLRDSIPEEIRKNIVIKVEKAPTEELLEKALEYKARSPQFYDVWIVFDRDEVVGFDSIISQSENKGVEVGWSNPCFEIWLQAYFGNMPVYANSVKCCEGFADRFQKATGKQYRKNDSRIYATLIEFGDEGKAIKIAYSKFKESAGRNAVPSKMNPATTVNKLVEEIRDKTM